MANGDPNYGGGARRRMAALHFIAAVVPGDDEARRDVLWLRDSKVELGFGFMAWGAMAVSSDCMHGSAGAAWRWRGEHAVASWRFGKPEAESARLARVTPSTRQGDTDTLEKRGGRRLERLADGEPRARRRRRAWRWRRNRPIGLYLCSTAAVNGSRTRSGARRNYARELGDGGAVARARDAGDCSGGAAAALLRGESKEAGKARQREWRSERALGPLSPLQGARPGRPSPACARHAAARPCPCRPLPSIQTESI